MAFITTTAPRSATGAVRKMYERQQQSWGFVPNYAKLFSHRPELMRLWAELLRGIRSHVDRRRFELVTLAAAHALRSSYCSLAHGKALTEFFTTGEIVAMLDGSDARPGDLTPAERAMMAYAAKIARDASRVNAGEVEALKSLGFSDAEVFDIAAIASARAFLTKIMDALGAEPDAHFLDLEEDFRHALTVGRPIDFKPLERLSAESPDAAPVCRARSPATAC